MAIKDKTPYIKIPHTGIQPRMALGYSLQSIYCVMKNTIDNLDLLMYSDMCSISLLNPKSYEDDGKALAAAVGNTIPIIYSSNRYKAISYNWKIKFNETAKIAAFYNTFPELNHNEMVGHSNSYNNLFTFIFFYGKDDHPKIVKRMNILKKQLQCMNYKVIDQFIDDDIVSVIKSVITVDWTSYYLAKYNGKDPENVPIIEEFKKELVN